MNLILFKNILKGFFLVVLLVGASACNKTVTLEGDQTERQGAKDQAAAAAAAAAAANQLRGNQAINPSTKSNLTVNISGLSSAGGTRTMSGGYVLQSSMGELNSATDVTMSGGYKLRMNYVGQLTSAPYGK